MRKIRLLLVGGRRGPTLEAEDGSDAEVRARYVGLRSIEDRRVSGVVFYDRDPYVGVADTWPKPGDWVAFLSTGDVLGHVVDVTDAIVTYQKANDVGKATNTFIWVHEGGQLNTMHTWKTRRNAGREFNEYKATTHITNNQ